MVGMVSQNNSFNQFPQIIDMQADNTKKQQPSVLHREYKNNQASNTALKVIPVVDSFIAAGQTTSKLGAAGITSLGAGMGSFAARMTSWGVFFGVFNLLSKGIDKITAKSPKLQQMQQEHPVAKSLVDLTALFGAYEVGRSIVAKAVKALPEGVKDKTVAKLSKLQAGIDSSKIAQKVFNPLVEKAGKFAANHQGIAKTVKAVTPWIVPAMIIASLAKPINIAPRQDV
ncbi:MAG: hypothetical protein PHV37_07500 [Candidatus Gastranaerophilales bacterium]|nr:hypothetical protein [Candidatus Gastranaerophilales bacterium]